MSTMANEKQTNLALISALSASTIKPSVPDSQSFVSALSECNIQTYSTALVVRPPSGVAAAACTNFDPPIQDTVSIVAQDFSATNVKLQSILKR